MEEAISAHSSLNSSESKTGGQGLYLYCLRGKSSASVKAVKTIDKGEVYFVPHRELEAVVSEVDLKEFSSEEIQRRAQEDLDWIKEKAQIHEYVIEQAMGVGGKIISVIPMRFGTIFKTKKGLEKAFKRGYSQFRKALGKLEGKQEWGVKVYLNEAHFAKDASEAARWKEEREKIASLPRGVDFFAKKKLDGAIKKERDRKLKRIIQKILEGLRKPALQVSQGKLLDRAITGRKEALVLNASFLVEEEKVGEFQSQVEGLKVKYQSRGLIIQESGPWPPYNFAEITSGQRSAASNFVEITSGQRTAASNFT